MKTAIPMMMPTKIKETLSCSSLVMENTCNIYHNFLFPWINYYSNNCALIISISHNLHDIQRPFTLQEFHVKFLCAFYDKFLSYAIFKWNEKLLHLHSYMKLTSISLENDISLLFYHDFFSCINIQLYTNNIYTAIFQCTQLMKTNHPYIPHN